MKRSEAEHVARCAGTIGRAVTRAQVKAARRVLVKWAGEVTRRDAGSASHDWRGFQWLFSVPGTAHLLRLPRSMRGGPDVVRPGLVGAP